MNLLPNDGRIIFPDYSSYRNYFRQLVEQGKTSGENQAENLIAFTSLNLHRTERIEKTLRLSEELTNLLSHTREQNWVVITEAWCGDSAQNLPVIGKLAEASKGKISLQIVLRYQYPELIQKYLTNGSQSIPKLVAFDQNGEELFTWGPRPQAAQSLLLEWKSNPNGRTWEDFEKELHLWYGRDRSVAIQEEFLSILKNLT